MGGGEGGGEGERKVECREGGGRYWKSGDKWLLGGAGGGWGGAGEGRGGEKYRVGGGIRWGGSWA